MENTQIYPRKEEREWIEKSTTGVTRSSGPFLAGQVFPVASIVFSR